MKVVPISGKHDGMIKAEKPGWDLPFAVGDYEQTILAGAQKAAGGEARYCGREALIC
jgi:hypothetical protein